MMNISKLYQLFLHSNGVTTDSRTCPAGSMFFALKGESFNGNAYAGKALEKGSMYAVIDEPEYAIEGDNRYIIVEDVLTTLQQLANYHRRQLNTHVIGITGTNGKTTTKELIAAVLSQQYDVLYTQGNLNNHIGVPLTLLRLAPEHDLAVVEMGANHPGEIKALAEIAEPNFGLITNVGKAHLEGFGSFEGVIKTKGELYSYLCEKGDSPIFLHHDNPYLTEMAKGLYTVLYGTADNLYVNGKITGNSPYLSIDWKAGEHSQMHHVDTRLIGEYNFANVMAAIAVGHYFDVSAGNIDRGLAAYTPQNNRSQLKQTPNNTLIIDAYNANPTSMMAALENFRNMKADSKMLILGDMKELGEDSAAEHEKIARYIQDARFEEVVLVGDEFRQATTAYPSFGTVEELIEKLQKDKLSGRTILIKGSNSTGLIKVVDHL